MRAVDHGAWHRTDHLERDGARDRQWRAFSKGRDFGAWLVPVPRQIGPEIARSWARFLEAGQSPSARLVRAGGPSCACQADDVEAPRAQAMDRIRQETPAPKRAGNRARQQACRASFATASRVLLFEPMPQVYMDSLAEVLAEGLNPAHGR